MTLQEGIEQLERYIQRWRKEFNAPGLAIAATDSEKLIWHSTSGVSDIGTQAPVTPDTLFEIGSLGKPFTNIALLQLRDEGKLDVYAPVSQYLPWFQVKTEFPPIAPHHLMSQTGGIIQGTDLAPHGLYESWALCHTRAGAPPGELCSYSNVGYKTLGFLVEKLTGQSFADAIQQRVLAPLEMDQTHAAITYDTRRKAATGYACVYDDRPEHPSYGLVPAIWSEYGTGDGCQASTAADMGKYLRLLINRGQGPKGRVISTESFGLLTQHVIWTGTDYYGYGLAMYPAGDRFLIGHGGATAGFTSAIIVDPDYKLGVVALANLAGEPDAVLQLTRYVLSVVRAARCNEDLPPVPVNNPSSVSNAAEYAGVYRSEKETLQLSAEADQLLLQHSGQLIPLERRSGDSFYVPYIDFALFLLEFQRSNGQVMEAFHGDRWFVNDQFSGPGQFDYPREWNAFPGHYRARSPRFSNFRVLLRKGSLVLAYPAGNVDPLVPLGNNLFRLGVDERLPDTIRFDAVVEGRALVADYCGCPYYRTFTP